MFDFNEMKEKWKVKYREKEWQTDLLNIITSMFEYKGFPEVVRTEFIELYLNVYGECAIWETREGWSVTYCVRAGSPNTNGLGKDLICTTWNGQTKTFPDFETRNDVVYIKNDDFARPDFNYLPTADILTDIDKSIKHIIINSRYTPIAVAKDEKTAFAIKTALEANNVGEVQVVLSNNILDGEQNAYVLNITDVTASDKIQYLYKAKDDTLRQFYQLYGMETCGASKMAQQTEAEINQGCNSHMILPNVRMKNRKAGIDKCKELFGWDCSVDFSEAWRREKGQLESFVNETTEEEKSETDTESEVVENEETI